MARKSGFARPSHVASMRAMGKPFIVIIAGGRGERFWPQSRAARPKHLLPVVGTKPLLTQTLERVKPLVPARNVFVITSAVQERAVREVCKGIPAENIIAEPVGRDTAAAVGLAAAVVGARDPGGVFAVLPADHVIRADQKYQSDLDAAFSAAAAEPVIVTIGIRPAEPATGFGYIQRGEQWRKFGRKRFHRVRRFVEKPVLNVAQQYLASGEYFWNAGMFVWSVPVVERGLAAHAPDLDAGLRPIRSALTSGRALAPVLKRIYPKLQKISIDYALLEKSSNVVMLPASFDWDDVGAWPAVARHYEPDTAGNVTRGRALVEQGSGNIVFAEGEHLVTVVGADNLIVVHTPDATLVCPKEKAQEIKALLKRVEQLKDAKRYL
jgi:mannose-1-phosphate guanylyltransferase